MRLNDDARGIVVYLGITDPTDPQAFDPVGTAFIVVMPDGVRHLVTQLITTRRRWAMVASSHPEVLSTVEVRVQRRSRA